MITHSLGFKQAITKTGRDLHIKIDFYKKSYNLQTENNKLIITQDAKRLLTEPIEQDEPISTITENDIISLKKNNLGEINHSYMKSFDLKTYHNFVTGDKVIIQIGTTVGNAIEYLNYGTYYIYKKQYSEVEKAYTYTLCDSMLFTNVKYDNNIIFGPPPESSGAYYYYEELELSNFVYNLIRRFILSPLFPDDFTKYTQLVDTTDLVNKTVPVSRNTFKDIDITVRDALDQALQAGGCSMIVEDIEIDGTIYPKFICKYVSNQVVDTIDDDILKDTNVTINEKFGPLNHIILIRTDGLDNIERKDDTSIANNGDTTLEISNNLILEQENRADFADALFNRLNGLEYITSKIDIIGLGYIEYLDRFNIIANDNLYRCICLQNTSEIDNGMEEKFSSERPVETKTEYRENTGYDDKAASILMDKLRGTIVLKTYQDGGKTKVSQVRLDSSGEDGSLVEISADNIKLEGYTTVNEHFNIDNSGDMQCTNAIITNANITNANITDGEFKMTDSINQTVILDITKQLDTDMDLYYAILNMNKFDGTQTEIEAGYAIFTGGTYGTVYIDAFNDPMLYCSGNLECGGIITSSNGVCQGSLEEKKKDFEELKSGLDIIKNIDIYKYRYKNENDTKKHIGLVIGDKYKYSKEVTNDKNDSVDIYSFVSVCCKAIQEQQEQIEQLKKEIKELKK